MFQSRNRGSCRFKRTPLEARMYNYTGFNLVIEVLVVSSVNMTLYIHPGGKFQSRNRGSCRFKEVKLVIKRNDAESFNLVIEVLVVSR